MRCNKRNTEYSHVPYHQIVSREPLDNLRTRQLAFPGEMKGETEQSKKGGDWMGINVMAKTAMKCLAVFFVEAALLSFSRVRTQCPVQTVAAVH